MFQIRRANQRGIIDHGWLKAAHTFSFGDYYDPEHMGFRSLRVINEDRVDPGKGFGMHGHKDMEIITYILEGALQHKDSLGNGAVLRPGEFQYMSAGSGVRHSEFNASATEPVHLYQIWILPDQTNLTPNYRELRLNGGNDSNDDHRGVGGLRLVASKDGREGSLQIHQDVLVYVGSIPSSGNEVFTLNLNPDRHVWIQVLRGKVRVDGRRNSSVELDTSDGLSVSDERTLNVSNANASEVAEIMVFDMA